MPKPTASGSPPSDGRSARGAARDVGDVEVAGAGHAGERDVVGEAAAARDEHRARARAVVVGASSGTRTRLGGAPAAVELVRLLGRQVDDQHPVDAGRRAPRRPAAPSPRCRIGL